jgi:dTDP-4-dehydrorhamnose 3,5-epimerase
MFGADRLLYTKMEFRELEISGVFEITLRDITDERGFFIRTYDLAEFTKAGLHREWLQENHSRSIRKGIIRGLHFQYEPFEETKLVRCIRGEVYDVVVDLRAGSSTFGKWTGLILSEENRKMIYVPRGFAHGFCTISEISEVVYKVDNVYSPDNEGGILWNDPFLSISWPLKGEPLISDKDRRNKTIREYREKFRQDEHQVV